MRKILPILVALTLICLIAPASAVNITAEGNGTIPAWNISTAVHLQLFDVSGQDTYPTGIFFKSDGTKMYVVGNADSDVNEYDLGTPWNISTAVYLQNFSVYEEDTWPTGLFFKLDGTKMYVIGYGNDSVNEYDLGTPWNISTAVYLQRFSVAGEETYPTGLFFNSIGTKMYVSGESTSCVQEYDLGTPWNISTAVHLQLFDVVDKSLQPSGLFFKPDGSKMYVTDSWEKEVNEYDLSTPWNISTAVHLQLFDVSGQETAPYGLFFKPDGSKMYVTGDTGDDVNEYDLAPGGSLAISTSISGRIVNSTIVIGEDASCTQEDVVNITNPSAYDVSDVLVNYVKPSGAGDLNKTSDSIATLTAGASVNRSVSYPWTLPDVVLSETGQGQIIERYAKYTFSLPRALNPDTEVTLTTLKIYLDTSQLPYFHHIEKVTVNGIERTIELENGRYYVYCSSLPAGENEVIVQYHKHDVSHDGGYSPMPDITPPEARPPAWQWFNEMMQNIREWICQHMRWRR